MLCITNHKNGENISKKCLPIGLKSFKKNLFFNQPLKIMPRPVTLFTGQWADLSLPDLAEKAAQMGYDGLELACWGDHFDVDKAAVSKKYCKERWEILSDNGLTSFAISSHLVGQAVCDLIDERHKAILPPDVWGEGNPEKVRKRAARKLAKTAKACRNFINEKPGRKKRDDFPAVVNGFTGSSIWHSIYAFPPLTRNTGIKALRILPNVLVLFFRNLKSLTSTLR